MGSETIQHANLICQMEAWVRAKFSHHSYFSILTDNALYPGMDDRPPKIKGSIPDLYATDVPETFCVVGEAKTSKDLTSRRSQQQLSNFIDYLFVRPTNDFFVLAVPYDATDRAVLALRNKCRQSKRRNGSVIIFVLNEVGDIKVRIP